jgi:hypothetical protein
MSFRPFVTLRTNTAQEFAFSRCGEAVARLGNLADEMKPAVNVEQLAGHKIALWR